MAFDIQLSNTAQANIDEAYLFYLEQKQSPKAAAHFYQRVQEALEAVALNPYYKTYNKSYRGFPLIDFPYIIFYDVDQEANAITVLAVFNTYQDTQKYPG